MLIGEFAQKTGLSQDTVRFYVRKGLLRPQAGLRGGRNPYQEFTERDLQTAQIVRFGQSLGMSLKELTAINDEMVQDGLSDERAVMLMQEQIDRLSGKASEIETLIQYLRAKCQWIQSGKEEPEPSFLCIANDEE
ncbi:helix-turn-helix domain-containing protein [Gluconobacter japonicus]|uniref:helix-turn-helix domain-containing protein n=1 Tax=Gluconobacter japonicus TaxID=376620 RepID=UPI00078312F6|nr:MerR family transcriptional regulator [Gluconobacter japonicus]KXV27928.1 MerR family transcriptional regulator [Gluconobacter japonicus]